MGGSCYGTFHTPQDTREQYPETATPKHMWLQD